MTPLTDERGTVAARSGSNAAPAPCTLELANPNLLFATDIETAQSKDMAFWRNRAAWIAQHIEESYPEVIEIESRYLRYAYYPGGEASKGLVVLFHGHDAFLHLGPMKPRAGFDLLAPWDTFGWNRRGSWFWGEKGDNFVERMVQTLIGDHRRRLGDRPWFCIGGSMGGFAALYHGIKYRCDGIYALCPQVDLRRLAELHAAGPAGPVNNPYGYLGGGNFDAGPDLLAVAEREPTLPPLFLSQNQFDPVNPFAEHAFKLIEVYNRKRAWLNLRILPAIGHSPFGGDREAQVFFSLLADKRPPRAFPTN